MEKPSAASARGNDDSGGKRTRIEVPVGCKFDPSDEELMFYLMNKILDSCEYSTGKKWFFYTVEPNDYVFSGDGYWTPTSEKAIYIGGQVDGYKKELIYCRGTEHPGKRTNWCIHQFRQNPDVYVANAIGNNVEYKKIYKKAGISTIYASRLYKPNLRGDFRGFDDYGFGFHG
ncbi:NAC domain-containing protein 100-like [Coffea arabica]|uniref:NAC domain-containing protein 100-like n=1 Tax=Coffea arabica TaxID=13443 RepID=A0A6P6TVC1_COFAR|nr:NAC domain-containing protein 76-like [Coffea arabica]